MTVGEDVFVELRSGTTVVDQSASTWDGAGAGCLQHAWSAPGDGGFGAGPYDMRVYVGPQQRRVATVPLDRS